MKIIRSNNNQYNLVIAGLGYESRAITACEEMDLKDVDVIAIGYSKHNQAINYQKNLEYYQRKNH